MAWKVRFAGCPPVRRAAAGIARCVFTNSGAETVEAAIKHLLLERSQGQFDPHLVAALSRCQAEFEQIYRDLEE